MEFNNTVFYQDVRSFSYQELLSSFQYIEHTIFSNQPVKRVALVLPDGITLACLLLYCLQKYEVLPLTAKYVASEYQEILKNFNIEMVITFPDLCLAVKTACENEGVRLTQIEKIESVIKPQVNITQESMDESFLTLQQGKLMLFTSGTTGKPKKVILNWNNLSAAINNMVYAYGISANDICLNVMPLYHIHGLVACLLTSVYRGASVILMEEGFNIIKFFQHLETLKPTWYSAVPTIHKSILNRAYAKHQGILSNHLRFIRSSSSGLPDSVAQGLREIFKVPVLQAYGLTETTNMAVAQTLSKPSTLNSVGYPLPTTAIVIRDENGIDLPCNTPGEVCLKGAGVFSGYEGLNAAQSGFFEDGFFRTGDVGVLAESGELTLISRLKELINKGGEKIAPQEIEEAALTYPLIDQAVCFGIEDDYYGENIGLAIVLKPAKKVSENTIKEYLANYLSEVKVPKEVFFLQELPTGNTGKLKRIELGKLVRQIDKGASAKRNVSLDNKDSIVSVLLNIWKNELQLSTIQLEDDFTKLGGDSFLAIRIVNEINKKLHVQISMASIFRYQNITSLALHILENQSPTVDISPAQLPADQYLLSFGQEGLWFIEQYAQGTNAYNIPLIFQLSDTMNLDALFASIRSILDRHEVLRSLIKTNKDSLPYQWVLSEEQFPLIIREHTFVDVETLNLSIKAEIAHIFDLATEYPIRVNYYVLDNPIDQIKTRYLSIVVHHIVFDGFWSKNLFLKELDSLYFYHLNIFSGTQNSSTILSLPSLSIQFKDFAMWQRQFLDEHQLANRLAYWETKLAGYEPLNLPTDFVRPVTIDYVGAEIAFELDTELSVSLRTVAKKLEVSLFSVLLSGYYLLLKCYSNQEDIVVGTVFANRHYPQIEHLIGYFVNSLPLRSHITAAQSLAEYIKNVSQDVVEAQLYQDLPFDKLVTKLGVKDASRHPIFQVLFEVRRLNQEFKLPLFQSLDYYEAASRNETAKFDLTATIDDSKDALTGVFNYRTSLFAEHTIAQYIETYRLILLQIGRLAAEVEGTIEQKCIKDLNYLSLPEYQKMLIAWNATEKAYLEYSTIHSMFEMQVLKTPHNIAVIYEDKQLTYTELNEKANQLAYYLRMEYQVQGDSLIALCLDRSEHLLAVILGVLKAGAAYVPIDPGYPEERISYILTDTKAKVVLSERAHQIKLQQIIENAALTVTIEQIDREAFQTQLKQYPAANPESNITSQNLAYLIYTSGTTGKPKGAMLQHQGIINRIKWMNDTYLLSPQDAIIQKTPYVFDVSVWELFWGIWYGARIVFAKPEGHKDARYLLELIFKRNISIMHFVPSLLNVFLQTIESLPNDAHKALPSLHYIFCSGEALPLADVKETHRLLSHVKLHNLYGPTEASVDVLYYDCSAENIAKVYIGKPIDNTTAYVLNKERYPLPIGAIGELYIGGVGLARGYLNRPELTAERFIANPFQTPAEQQAGKHQRLYKTGDLVRYSPDGNIDYIGRTDFQVKIRGYRIELEEIENVLSSFPGITRSVVIVKSRENKTQYLIGYYLAECSLDEAKILKYLQKKLPEYMVPKALVWLERLPLNINGKLDQKLLPVPELAKQNNYVAPVTEIERKICDIYAQVLGISSEKIGVYDDFFSLGGYSLLIIKLTNQLNQEFKVELSVADVFQQGTIHALTHSIEALKDKAETVKEIWRF